MLESDASAQEIEKRLDELFTDIPPENQSKPAFPESQSAAGMSLEHHPVKTMSSENQTKDSEEDIRKSRPLSVLKSIVLSMDWEITDNILNELLQELERLKVVLSQDVIAVKCLQLLEALGKYIQKKKARTHPDSVKLLQAIYRDLEIMLLSGGISSAAKRTILADEFAQFKELKAKLVESSREASSRSIPYRSRFAPEGNQKPESVKSDAVTDDEHLKSHEVFRCTLNEIKKTLHSEFSALRAEIMLWRNGE